MKEKWAKKGGQATFQGVSGPARQVSRGFVSVVQNLETPFDFEAITATISHMEKSKVSDPMRLFTLVVSVLFIAIGIAAIASGNSDGWLIAGFFGLCLLVAIFEPWFPKPWATCDYRLVMTDNEVACEHPKRPRESIRWEAVNRIWYVTTSDGPRLPDEWLLLEGENGGCSFPTEARGFDGVWDELKQRFVGFDYGPLIRGGTMLAKHLCWERQRGV